MLDEITKGLHNGKESKLKTEHWAGPTERWRTRRKGNQQRRLKRSGSKGRKMIINVWCPERPVKKECPGRGKKCVNCWWRKYDRAENCLMDLVTWRSLVTLTKQFQLLVQDRMGKVGNNTDESFKELCCKAEEWVIVKWGFYDLASLTHGIAASASIFFEQAAYRGLRVTLVPHVSTYPIWQPQSHRKMSSWYDFPSNSYDQQSSTSQGLPLVCPLDKTPVELTKTPLIWVQIDQLVLVWGPQRTPPIKACDPSPVALSACTLPWLPLMASGSVLCISCRTNE